MTAAGRNRLPSQAAAACSRRGFLLTVVTTALALAGCGEQGSSQSAARVPPWLPGAVGDVDAAARLGRVYLADHPHERQLDTLLTAIDAALGGDAGSGGRDPQQVLGRLQEVVRADYRRDAAVNVQGWVLSVTEARVYAVLALAANS